MQIRRPKNAFSSSRKISFQLRTSLFLTCNASVNSSGAHLLPRATAGHLLTLSVPGVGHSQFYRGPGVWALAYPGATPRHLTHAFSKDGWYEFIGKDEAFVKDWLVRKGLEKLVDVSVKVFLVNFRYFFITCKHINRSDKVNYILYINHWRLSASSMKIDINFFRIFSHSLANLIVKHSSI